MVRTLFTPLVIVVGLVMLAAAVGLSSMSTAEGGPAQQYPPPCPCVVTVSVGEAAPNIEDCIPITCKATDTAGAPVVDLECRMSVITPTGTDATVSPGSVTTDVNGEATAELCVGSIAGSIVVEAETDCCGSTGQVEVAPGAVLAPPPAEPGAPPATGAGTGGGDSWPASLIAILSAIAFAAGSVLVWRIGSRRRRSS